MHEERFVVVMTRMAENGAYGRGEEEYGVRPVDAGISREQSQFDIQHMSHETD